MAPVTQQSMWNVMEPLTSEERMQVYDFAIKLRKPKTGEQNAKKTTESDEIARYEAHMEQTQQWARDHALSPDDITKAIKAVRQKKRQSV